MAYTDPNLTPKPKPWLVPGNEKVENVPTSENTRKTPPWLLPQGKKEERTASQIVPGFEREEYEKILSGRTLSPYNIGDLDYERAISQSTGSQLANGVGRIVLNTLPGIVSNFASMLDVEDYFNQDAEVGNAITNAVNEWKQGVSKALPIYREHPGKSFDLGDSGWWIENGSSLVGSIAEFAATGAGLGALLGGLSKMGQAGELAATLLSATGLNQAESIQDATSTYKTIFEREVLKGSSPYIAAEKAAQAASTVINIDRANILLNLTSANLFMKRPVGTRLKLDAPSITRDVKRAGMEGLQEYAEETVNYIAQEEGLDEDEQLTFDEVLDRVSSLEGIEAGVLGFIGGMGQTGGTAIANRLTGKTKEEQERYLNQVKEIDDINNMLKEQNLSTISDVLMDQSQIADLNKEIREAEASEDKDLKDKTYNKVLGFREYKSFVNGTTEDLINVFEKIKSLSPEDAAKKGLDTDEKSENYYTNLAEKAIKQIKRDENIYNTLNLSQYYNGAEILQNRSEYHDLQKKIDDIDNSINKIKNVLPEEELHKSKTEPFENLKEGYIVRQKSLTKEFQQITSKEHQKKLAEEYQKKANLIKETSKEIKKNIVKSNPSKLNEVLESTLEPDEINELKQTAATASKKERIGSDSALFPEVKPEIKPTKKKFVLEDKEARESLLKETKESNEKTVENEKLGIDNYINSKKDRPTFSKDVERKRNAILAKKFPKEVEDTLLQYIDDSHYSETGLRLSPVTDELKNEINTKKKTSKGKQTFDRTEESDIINKTIDSTITNTTEYKDPGLLTIAFRGKEEDGTINPRYFPLINPNLFNAGTKITLRVNDNPDTIVDFKTKQTWGQLKSQIKSESEIADRIPIEVVYEGNVIAYLHDSTWKPEKTKDTTNLDIQRKELSSLRNHVYSNGEIETTVERKSAGVLEKTSESRTLSELPNDSNMLFHVSTIKGLTNLKDTFVYNDPNFVGKNIGHTFISVVVGKENGQNRRLLYDTTNARLGENKELSDAVYETIETAVTIYHKNKLKLLDELDRKIIKDIEDSTGLRIINYGDLHKYLSQFIQLADLGKKQTLEDISELYDNDLHLLALNPNGFEVLVRENDSQSFSFIQLGEKKGWTVKTMNLLKDNIDNYFTHVSKNAIEDNKPLVLINRGKVTTMYNTYTDYLKATLKTNLNPVEISEGVVAYTLQNRIFISNPVKTAEVKKDISKDELKKRKDEITEIVNTILKDKDPKSLQSIEEGITEIEEKLAIPSSMIDYVENQLLEKFQEYDATIVKKQILSTFLDPTVIKSLDVKETTKPIEVKKKTDIEKQKSDIERRRQEELDNQAGNIRVKTEVVEGINDNDEPTRILIHTNKDGSRTVQFEGKFNGEKDWTRIGTEKVSADTPLEARGYANRTYGIQKPRVVEIIENPKSLPADKINAKYDAELKALENTKKDSNIFKFTKQELESSREIETLYDLRNPIAEDSKEIISKIEEANKLRKDAQEKSEQAVKETNEEKRIALNSDVIRLNEKAQILDKEVKKSRDIVINNTPIKQAIHSTWSIGQKLLNKIKLAAKSNEWVSSMPISKEEFTKLEDAIKRLSVKKIGEVTSNSEVIPDILLIEEINAKYDAELKVLEGKESTRVEEVKDEVSDENQKKVDELLKKFHFGNNEKDDDVNYDFEIGTDLSEVEKNVKSFLIKEMGSRRQQDFINYLTSLVIRKVSKTAKSDKPIKVSLKDISDGLFFKLKEDVDNANEILKLDPNQPEALRVIAVNKTINDNREFLENMAYYSLQKVGIIKIKNDADLESDEDLLGGDETQNEKTKFDQHSAEVDTKNKVSRELKLFMSGIHEFKKDKTIARNFLNRRKFMDWETVFNDLQNLTANVLPDFDYIINRLKGYVDSRPYLNEVINRLEKSPRNIQNQFVEIMSNHANHMELVLIDKRGKKYTYIIQKSNLNDVATRLSEYWSANFFDSKLVTTNVDGEFKYDSKVLNELTSEYTSWKNPTISQVSAWLEKIGIVLSEQSWKAIQEGEYVDRKTKYNLDTFVTKGTIKFIYDRLAGVTSSTVITPEDNLLKDQSVEELSKFDSRFTMTMLSNSHRAGNKQVYTFNQNKFLVNNFIDLKNLTDHGNGIFTSKLLTEKAKGIFSSRSWWLHKMVEHESNGEIKYYNGEVVVNPNGLFFSNFDYTTSDLEAMKEFGKPSEDNREMVKLSPMEVEVTKIGRIQSTNFVNRSNEKFSKGEKIGEVSYLTTSDKPTPMMIRTILPDLKLDIDGNPTEETYKFLLDQLVMPEIDRMFLFKKHKDQGVDYNNKEYEAGAKYFLIIPELNKIEGIFDKNGFISDGVDSADDPTLMNKIKEELKKHIESLIKEKKEKWTNWKIGETFNWPNGEIKVQDAFLDANFADKYLKSTDKLNAAVTHYVLNNLVSNVNIAMLFATDPANYFVEDSRKSLDNNIRDTFTNLGKRLAADAGPKTSNQDSLTSSSIEAVVDDLELDSLFFNEYLMKLDGITREQWDNMSKSERKKLNSYQYSQIKGTDAQEFMTVKEHLRDLDSRGRLNPILYPNAARLIDEEIEKGNHYYNKIVHDKLEEIEEGLGDEYNKIILTPVKPQYTYNIFDPNLRVEKRVFIKSSAYPLSDNFTKNKELDRLRIAMESQAIDRLAFKSAVKTGAPKTSTKLWTNGVMKYSPSRALWNEYDTLRLVKDKTEEQKKRFEELDANYIFFNDSNTLVLPRRGYGIQQETPFDPLKEHINRVTQAHKNIFVDLLDVDGFEYNGEKLVGRDLAKIYNEKFKSLFKYLYDDLKTELGLDDDLKVTPNLIDKVKEVIRKEMMERNYALSDIEFLQLENSLNMIAYLPSSSKIEALLNSIVKNRILKMKFPGYSFILGSEEGYQIIDDFYRYKGSIVFTDKFKGTLGKNQIIIPFRYTDKEGNLLDLQKFVKKGKIDTEMLPPELLEMFAMRIPNSSQSLQSVVEVAGFFPVNTDLIIATRDFIARMGQDFDVDKMYIYKTATEFVEGKDNKKAYFKRTEDVKESIMNDIIDIMKSVHKNPNAFKKVNTPLGMWKLQDIADDIEKINADRQKVFSGFSDEYQTNKFIQATQAKSAVGIYAALSIFNATAQEQGLVLTEGGKERLPVEVKFGSKVSHGEMSDKNTLSGKTTKSVVIEGTLSSSLDNEKLQILDKLNMNKDTFSVVSLLEMLGFEEEIFYFITQESINKYFDIANTAESTGEFLDAGQVFGKLVEEYTKKDPSIKDMSEDSMIANADELGYKELRQMLIEGDSYKDYYKHQIGLLMKFLRLQGYADSLGTPLKLLSVDSQGFGKSLLEANEYVDALERLSDSKIDNVGKLFGEFTEEGEFIEPTTIPGFSIYYGLLTNYNLWNPFFPYRKLGYKKYRDLLNSYLRTPKTIGAAFEMSKIAWESMKSFVYSKQNLGLLNNESIEEFRKRAFFGENSLASITLKARTNIKNDFLNALDFSIGKDNLPSLVKYKASAKSNDNELRLYSSFIDLLLNEQDLGVNGQPLLIRGKRYTSRNLYHDLVTSFYITGGNQKANQYGRYISPSYLYSIPFGKELMNFDFVNPSNIGISYELLKDATYIPSVIIQVIQHHPELVGVKVNSKSIKETSEGVTLDEKFLKKYKESHENDPKVFSVYDRKASYGKKVYEPYILVGYKDEGSTPLYKRINAKGTTDFDEYNSNIKYNEVDSSMLAKKPVKLTLDYSHKEVPDEQDNPLNSPDYTFEDIGVVATSNEQDSNKVIKDVLDTISSESTSLYNRQIAGWFRDYVSFNIKKIEVNKADPYNKGSYNYRTKKLTFWLGKYSKVAVENTFLHELIHHITGEGLRKDKKTLKEIEEIRKYVLDKIINSDLKEDYYIIQQFLIEKKIDSLKKEGKKNMSPEIQSLRKEINKISKIIGVVPDVRKFILENKTRFDKTKPIVYGITDAQEFVETILREEEMQRFLNEIPSKNPKKKSVFHEILDKLLSVIRDFIGVKEGSVLEDALEASIKLINIYPENFTTETTEESPVFDINTSISNKFNPNEINYIFKSVQKIFDNKQKVDQWSKQIKDVNKLLDKVQKDLGIPKDQIDLLRESEGNTLDEKLTNFIANYSYSVEINTQKRDYNYNKPDYIEEELSIINSNYYSNLTVPGGTNYTENEISTPLITPSIKGHAQFSTDKGIGWFRSDEQRKDTLTNKDNWITSINDVPNEFYYNNGKIKVWKDSSGEWNEGNKYIENAKDVIWKYNQSLGNTISKTESTKTRRILEIQSDLFQKGRDKEDLVNKEELLLYGEELEKELRKTDKPWDKYNEIEKNSKIIKNQQNNFLQLLNKDNNWVTFFIKSIIQDSAKKGYEKVLFPRGETAAKVEGHESIAEELDSIDYELRELDGQLEDYNTLERREELNKRKQELKSQGIEKLKPIEAFYEIKVGNILKKNYTTKEVTDEYGNQWREITINENDLDSISFDIGLPTVEETLKKFNEIDKDGKKKRLRVQTDGSNTNYKAMLKRVIDINQGQDLYKASVIKTLVNNKEFWTISLEKKNNLLTFEDRYNAITDDIVQKYIKNCR